jgi:hypothetical protein
MAIYTGEEYKLRASSPMPISGDGNFVIHTFMAAVHTLAVDTCTTSLPLSSSFVGQGGSNVSANFSRLPIKGGNYFQGRLNTGVAYKVEDSLGFN